MNEVKWEMKLFAPFFYILHAVTYSGGDVQKCPILRLQHYCCHGNTHRLLVSLNLIFRSEHAQKCDKCKHLFLESI